MITIHTTKKLHSKLPLDDQGYIASKINPHHNGYKWKVRYSIRRLHFDKQELNESRRACWSLVTPILNEAKRWFLEKLSDNPEADHNFQNELRKLRMWLNPKNPASYIGFMFYKLRNDKGRNIHPWIDIIIGDPQ